MINHWKASRGCDTLNRYVQETSKESYKELLNSGVLNTQMQQLIKTYIHHPEGLTDVQASKILNMDASTLSARRNDITKRYGSHVIVKTGTRSNGKGRRTGIVWNINKNLIEE